MPALSAPPHITAPPDLWYHHGPSLDIHIHLVLVNQNRSQCSRCLTSAEKGLIASFDLLATLFQTQPKIPFTYFAARVHCWLTFNLLNRTTRAFSAKLLSRQSDPILSQYPTLLLPKCRALHFPLFSFTEQSLLCSFLQPAQIPLHDSTNCVTYKTPTALLRVHSVPALITCSYRYQRHHTVLGPSTDLSSWTTRCSSEPCKNDGLEAILLSVWFMHF